LLLSEACHTEIAIEDCAFAQTSLLQTSLTVSALKGVAHAPAVARVDTAVAAGTTSFTALQLNTAVAVSLAEASASKQWQLAVESLQLAAIQAAQKEVMALHKKQTRPRSPPPTVTARAALPSIVQAPAGTGEEVPAVKVVAEEVAALKVFCGVTSFSDSFQVQQLRQSYCDGETTVAHIAKITRPSDLTDVFDHIAKITRSSVRKPMSPEPPIHLLGIMLGGLLVCCLLLVWWLKARCYGGASSKLRWCCGGKAAGPTYPSTPSWHVEDGQGALEDGLGISHCYADENQVRLEVKQTQSHSTKDECCDMLQSSITCKEEIILCHEMRDVTSTCSTHIDHDEDDDNDSDGDWYAEGNQASMKVKQIQFDAIKEEFSDLPQPSLTCKVENAVCYDMGGDTSPYPTPAASPRPSNNIGDDDDGDWYAEENQVKVKQIQFDAIKEEFSDLPRPSITCKVENVVCYDMGGDTSPYPTPAVSPRASNNIDDDDGDHDDDGVTSTSPTPAAKA